MDLETETKKPEVHLPMFDYELSRENPVNVLAVEVRGWKYDEQSGMYRDFDGLPVADRCGQPLG
jgi:hypothetical protein